MSASPGCATWKLQLKARQKRIQIWIYCYDSWYVFLIKLLGFSVNIFHLKGSPISFRCIADASWCIDLYRIADFIQNKCLHEHIKLHKSAVFFLRPFQIVCFRSANDATTCNQPVDAGAIVASRAHVTGLECRLTVDDLHVALDGLFAIKCALSKKEIQSLITFQPRDRRQPPLDSL